MRIERSRRVGSAVRTAGVIGVVVAIVTGVAYAALQSQQASLTNNTIESATADLRIGTSPTSFAASRTGFAFKDLVPGGLAMPANGNSFYLKNYGTAGLHMKVAVSSVPVNVAGVDLTKVSLILTRVDRETKQTFTLQSLVDSFLSGGLPVTDVLDGGAATEFTLKATMSADAFSGQTATINDVDIVFSGTAL